MPFELFSNDEQIFTTFPSLLCSFEIEERYMDALQDTAGVARLWDKVRSDLRGKEGRVAVTAE